MDRLVVEAFLCRAAAAESVRELHAIAQAARRAHPDDADTELIERVCWAAVPRLFTAARPAATHSAAVRPAVARHTTSRAPAHLPAAGRERRPRFDWKARAAGM